MYQHTKEEIMLFLESGLATATRRKEMYKNDSFVRIMSDPCELCTLAYEIKFESNKYIQKPTCYYCIHYRCDINNKNAWFNRYSKLRDLYVFFSSENKLRQKVIKDLIELCKEREDYYKRRICEENNNGRH